MSGSSNTTWINAVPQKFKSTLTERRGKANVYAPKATALLSILGSSYIIYDLLKKKWVQSAAKKFRVRQKILLVMSMFDLSSSLWLFLGNWMVDPEDFPLVIGASGTQGTCTAQGFFFQLGLSVPLYNVSLAVGLVLMVNFGWRESKMEEKASMWLLCLPAAFALSTAFAGLFLDLYNFNPSNFSCWIAPFPPPCGLRDTSRPVPECIRGENARFWTQVFGIIPLAIATLLVITLVAAACMKVYQTERKSAQWDFRNSVTFKKEEQELSDFNDKETSDPSDSPLEEKSAAENCDANSPISWKTSTMNGRESHSAPATLSGVNKKTWAVTVQGLFFVTAFLATWMPFLVVKSSLSWTGEWSYGGALTNAMLVPAQGFFNFLVYVLPSVISHIRHSCISDENEESDSRNIPLFPCGWYFRRQQSRGLQEEAPRRNPKEKCSSVVDV